LLPGAVPSGASAPQKQINSNSTSAVHHSIISLTFFTATFIAARRRSKRRFSTAKGSAGLATRHVSSRNTLQQQQHVKTHSKYRLFSRLVA
jgi:hypothetical protein